MKHKGRQNKKKKKLQKSKRKKKQQENFSKLILDFRTKSQETRQSSTHPSSSPIIYIYTDTYIYSSYYILSPIKFFFCTKFYIFIHDWIRSPWRALRYAFPALISCRAPGLNLSRIFWNQKNNNNNNIYYWMKKKKIKL